jgi:hypothetical protein
MVQKSKSRKLATQALSFAESVVSEFLESQE